MRRTPSVVKVFLTSLLFFLSSCSTTSSPVNLYSPSFSKKELVSKWMGYHGEILAKMKNASNLDDLGALSVEACEVRASAERDVEFWFSVEDISSGERDSFMRAIQLARGEEMIAYERAVTRLGGNYAEER